MTVQVTLISADKQKFEVDIEVAKMSQTIKDMVEGKDSRGNTLSVNDDIYYEYF